MTGYTDQYRKQHEAEVKAAEEEQAERDRANAAARKLYLAKLEAERQAERDAQDAQRDEELAPTKVRLQRQWLVDHPDKSAADFDNIAWPLLKANIVEDQREQLIQNEIAAQRSRMGIAS